MERGFGGRFAVNLKGLAAGYAPVVLSRKKGREDKHQNTAPHGCCQFGTSLR